MVDKVKKIKVDKATKAGYKVLDKLAKKAEIKANRTDAGGNFYVYNLYDENGVLIALNRYVYKDSDEQPFDTLTVEEEEILNPVVEEVEEEMIKYGK